MALAANAPVQVDGNVCQPFAITEVDTGIGIAAYRDVDSNQTEARVIDITGGSISVGAQTVYNGTPDGEPDIDKLETDKAFSSVWEGGASGYVKGMVLTRSSSTVSSGTLSSAADTGDVNAAACCVATSSKALVAWDNSTGGAQMAHFSISGTTATPGTAQSISTRIRPVSACRLTSTYSIVFGRRFTATGADRARFILVDTSGTNPSSSDEVDDLSGNLMAGDQGDIARLDDNTAIATWEDDTTSPGDTYAVIITRSGSTISVGTPQLVNSNGGQVAIVAPNATEAVHFDGSGTKDGTATKLTISGTTITVTADTVEFGTTASVDTPGAAILSDTKPVICYYNATDGRAVLLTGAPSSGASTYEIRHLGLASDSENLYVTGNESGTLTTWVYDLSTLTEQTSYTHGAATYAELDNRTYGVFPAARPGSDNILYIYGRDGNDKQVQYLDRNGTLGVQDVGPGTATWGTAKYANALMADPLTPNDVIVSFDDDDLYRTTDATANWVKMGDATSGLRTSQRFPTDSNEIILGGTAAGTAHYTPNFGVSYGDVSGTSLGTINWFEVSR
jgi:hypothetical protein